MLRNQATVWGWLHRGVPLKPCTYEGHLSMPLVIKCALLRMVSKYLYLELKYLQALAKTPSKFIYWHLGTLMFIAYVNLLWLIVFR